MTKSKPGRFLEEITWPEAAERFQADAVVVVPVGAAAKEHGHHLPLNTELVIARALMQRLTEVLPVVIAPTISFGYSPVFQNYAGSQHISAETFVSLVAQLLSSLVRQGATRITMVNIGDSTEGPLRLAVNQVYDESGVRVATSNFRVLGRGLDSLLEQDQGGHADERTTSMMLAIAPDAVRMERTRPDYGRPAKTTSTVFTQPVRLSGDDAASDLDYSATGSVGDPTLATAKKGERLLDEITEQLVDGLRELFPEIDKA